MGARSLGFNSWAGQTERSVAYGLSPLQRFFRAVLPRIPPLVTCFSNTASALKI